MVIRARAQGFAYLTVLFIVAIMTGGLAVIGQVWHTAALREREAELLHVGNEYRKAIERYYLAGPRQYPKNLSDLIKDPRLPGTVRHLRRIYPDPITAGAEWGLVKAPDGGFAGVYSLSEASPLKISGFAVRDAAFESKTKYSDWQFIYAPALAAAATPAPKPAASN
jgi:type II secretory pathway pseudopilin PulG